MKESKRSEREAAILQAALEVFGEKGFADATVSAICKAAGVSEPTLYEYFGSKEVVLFAIAELYTRREIDRMATIVPYIHRPDEKIRVFIQAYLEFYEANPLYTSVALLTLKAHRRFKESPAYQTVREATRPIVTAYEEGVEAGLFREDIDSHLVRNLVLGFIEHLTAQWLLVGRPESLAGQRDVVFDLVMRAVSKEDSDASPNG